MKLFKSSTSQELEVTVSNRTLIRTIAIAAAAVLVFFAVSRSLSALALLGTALFLALALNAPVHWLSTHLPGKRRGSRTLATFLSIIIILAALIGFLAAIVPPIARQTSSFVSNVPSLVSEARDQNSPVGSFIRRYKLEKQVDQLSSQLSSRLGNISTSALSVVSKIGSSIFAVLTVLVLTVMMLLEGPEWIKLGYRLIPSNHRSRAKRLSSDMLLVIQGYVNGQVTLAALASVLIVPIFFITHVSYPFALMVVVFICGLIPMVGHTIGAIICTIVALFTSLPAALIVLGYYILYQQIENYTLQPKIQSNSTNMSPLLVFVAVLLGANFGGLLGALVSIPVMGCIRILVLDYLERRDILSPAEVAAAVGDDLEKPTSKK